MKLNTSLVLMACLLFINCAAVEETGSDDNVSDDGGDDGSDSDNDSDDDSDGDSSAGDIPSGSFMMFATLDSGAETESFQTSEGTVTWDEIGYAALRYIPTLDSLDLAQSTTSFDFASSYLYAMTVGSDLYTVRVSTDTGTKRITKRDPETLEALDEDCVMDTADTYRGFWIIGDQVFYISEISTDLFGDYSGGGHLLAVDFPCTDEETEVLNYNDADNSGEFYAIGNTLISIVSPLVTGPHTIRTHSTITGAVTATLLETSDPAGSTAFFMGDDALYWYKSAGGTLSVVRYPLTGAPETIIERELTGNLQPNVGIDASDDHVFLVYSDDDAHFIFYDRANDTELELDISSDMYSTTIYGNAQFIISN